MTIIRNLKLKFISRYYFLQEEYDKFSELYNKLDTLIKFLNPNSKNCGIIDDLSICDGSDHIVLINLPDKGLYDDKRIILIVIDVFYLWGKFNCLYNLITHNLIADITDFRVKNWKKYIELHGRQYENPASHRFVTNSLFIARLSQTGLLRHLPILKKTGVWKTKKHIYGHPEGYPIEFVRRDSSLTTKVNMILSQLSDSQSKEAYRNVMFGKPVKLWERYFKYLSNTPQYFDYIKLNEESTVINAGVENGFELPYFLSFKVNHIFNIDPTGMVFLNDYAKDWCQKFPERLTFIEKVLYHIDGETAVGSYNRTTLQEIIQEYKIKRIDLIKTDIEGAERNIFSELQPIIDKFRPQLAIAIYHSLQANGETSISDLTDMPLKLFEFCKEYNFYIGCYSYERWETIMYCIPKEIDANY